MKKIIKIHKKDKFKIINANFIIPKPNKKSILMSKKLQGGVLIADSNLYFHHIVEKQLVTSFHQLQ